MTSSPGGPGPQASPAGRGLSLVEAELGRLSHAYAMSLDRGDVAGFVALFLPDGRLTVARGGRIVDRFEGRSALAGVLDLLAGFDRTRHAVLAHGFEVGTEAASGRVAMEAHHVRLGEERGSDTVLHGEYHDEYGLDEEGRWRFASRRLEVGWSELREVVPAR